MKSAFQIKLQGYPPANRDATVRLVHEGTGATVERKVFLDGTLLVRDLDPGMWDVEVRHPNLVVPIDKRRIRLFPSGRPTIVPVPIPPDIFQDNPIRDIPDADLTPVQQTAAAVKSRVAPLGAKAAGELIRAEDWNAMATAVGDLAGALMDLTQLVAPRGHDHPEIAEKFAEVQGNLRRFQEAFGKALLEMRREIEADRLDEEADVVLATAPPEIRADVLDKIRDLRFEAQADPGRYSRKMQSTGNRILEAINAAAAAPEAPDDFFDRGDVRALTEVARNLTGASTAASAEAELNLHQASAAKRKRAIAGIGG